MNKKALVSVPIKLVFSSVIALMPYFAASQRWGFPYLGSSNWRALLLLPFSIIVLTVLTRKLVFVKYLEVMESDMDSKFDAGEWVALNIFIAGWFCLSVGILGLDFMLMSGVLIIGISLFWYDETREGKNDSQNYEENKGA